MVNLHDYCAVRQRQLQKLQDIRENLNDSEIETNGPELLCRLEELYLNWKGYLPNLREIFGQKVVEKLLYVSVKSVHLNKSSEGKSFINFVTSSGYRDEPYADENGKPVLRRATALHYAANLKCERKLIAQLFDIYNKFDVNYVNWSGLSHFHVACAYGLEYPVEIFLEHGQDPITDRIDLVEIFFKNDSEKRRPVQVDVLDDEGNAPLHLALESDQKEAAELLLRNGANPNLARAIDGYTPLHIICSKKQTDYIKIFFDINHANDRKVDIDAKAYDALHLSLKNKKKEMAELLLRNGADPNSANNNGYTPLHIVCRTNCDLARIFFWILDEMKLTVQMNAQDNLGNTPLHMALRYGRKKMIKLLLERGADPNLANKKGSTLIHIVCDKDYKIEFAQMLLSQKHQRVLVDVLDNDGNTPLTLSLEIGRRDVAELLLKYGANLNFANNDGETLLHIFCRKINLLRILFELCDEQQLQVQVDAVDKFGRTPLQLAVANLNLDAFDLLLDRGADVSRFAFPTESYYGAGFDSKLNYSFDVKLKMASGALAILDSLEKRGYELDGSDALTIMKFFAKHGLFETSPDLQQRWYDEKEFASKAKKKIMKPGLSLYGLIQLRPDEAAKELTYRYYHELACAKNYPYFFSNGYQKIDCSLHLCEKLSRGFFRGWAMESFMKLIHYRLPLECCDMIVDHLKNEDLCNICLAAADETVRGDGNSNRPVNISDSDTDSDGHF
uniref:Uncharacterized protein n=1 Tax=Trichogramma kaykai TaxID=54128 RepID=A0ABD2X9A0_9HYME